MTPSKKFLITKAILNIISGISLITIISLGVAYMSFTNAFVFQDINIEVTNNPVGVKRDIEFMMIGSKKHECSSTKVYGIAYAQDGSHSHSLDLFSKSYTRNVSPGMPMPNTWHMKVPSEMEDGGIYRVSMTGHFICNYLIFQTDKSQTFDNIYLKITPR